MYEGGIRTPAIIAWPGHLKPRAESSPIHVADWFPTFATVAGYEPIADLNWDGSNLWPVLTGEAKPRPRTLYLLGPGGKAAALRHGDHVLVRQKGKPDELYDLAIDTGQKDNLAKTHPAIVADLAARLEKAAERDNDAKLK